MTLAPKPIATAPHRPQEATTARLPIPDLFAGMNGTERARGIQLEALRRDGQIADWRFESLTLKLAPACGEDVAPHEDANSESIIFVPEEFEDDGGQDFTEEDLCT